MTNQTGPLIPQTLFSNQAESSSLNPIASGIRVRTLVELQVISYLLSEQLGETVDLAQLRRDLAADILGQS